MPGSIETKWSDRQGFYPDSKWLAQHQEAPLEPELPIVDAHHHLWHRPLHRYLLEEYAADVASGHNVIASVCIEAKTMYRVGAEPAWTTLGEVEFLNGVGAAAASGFYGPSLVCAGIVSFADLTLGDRVQPILEAHLRAGGDRFRGVRHASAWDACADIGNSHTNPTPDLLLTDRFRAGFARLAPLGLCFDAWLYHPQIPHLVSLARAFPDTSIVVDHMGGPLGRGPYAGRRDEVFAQWKGDIGDLADCPNTVVKLGGLAMRRMALHDFSERPSPPSSEELAAAWRPYVETCIEAFGPERCMFESNFPVDKVSCSYQVLWNAFKRLARGASTDEKALLFSDVARRVYRLEV